MALFSPSSPKQPPAAQKPAEQTVVNTAQQTGVTVDLALDASLNLEKAKEAALDTDKSGDISVKERAAGAGKVVSVSEANGLTLYNGGLAATNGANAFVGDTGDKSGANVNSAYSANAENGAAATINASQVGAAGGQATDIGTSLVQTGLADFYLAVDLTQDGRHQPDSVVHVFLKLNTDRQSVDVRIAHGSISNAVGQRAAQTLLYKLRRRKKRKGEESSESEWEDEIVLEEMPECLLVEEPEGDLGETKYTQNIGDVPLIKTLSKMESVNFQRIWKLLDTHLDIQVQKDDVREKMFEFSF